MSWDVNVLVEIWVGLFQVELVEISYYNDNTVWKRVLSLCHYIRQGILDVILFGLWISVHSYQDDRGEFPWGIKWATVNNQSF